MGGAVAYRRATSVFSLSLFSSFCIKLNSSVKITNSLPAGLIKYTLYVSCL